MLGRVVRWSLDRPRLIAWACVWFTLLGLLYVHDMKVELPNPRGVPMCVRVLLLYNTPRPQSSMRFAYLRGAQAIKADLDYLRGTLIP